MIHFGKPFPETLGAIFAGIFLGTLAFRTGSIWIGFFIHESVAFTMDIVSLLHTGGLPTHFWPS
jgi:membrane protease YdiL (CAAX protease family)